MGIDSCQAYWLALVQGITEFLPISSSAHLILMPRLFHFPDQGLAFDVAVHLGTLLAVVGALRQELWQIGTRFWSGESRTLGLAILIGTLPTAVLGLLAHHLVEGALRNPTVIATTTLLFGMLLGAADRLPEKRFLEDLTLRDALLVGLAQAVALVPGTSRSGITITAGRFLGFGREDAARFSFLLAIPTIALAAGYETVRLVFEPDPVDWGLLGLAVLVSWLSAYGCLNLFLATLSRIGLAPFVAYRLLLAGLLFWLF